MAIAVLWRAVFRDDGLINTIIKMVTFGHFEGPSWLSDPGYALWVICILRIWQFGSAMVLFLAALTGVPATARGATIDGAGKMASVLLPSGSHDQAIIFYNPTQICRHQVQRPLHHTNGGPRTGRPWPCWFTSSSAELTAWLPWPGEVRPVSVLTVNVWEKPEEAWEILLTGGRCMNMGCSCASSGATASSKPTRTLPLCAERLLCSSTSSAGLQLQIGQQRVSSGIAAFSDRSDVRTRKRFSIIGRFHGPDDK